MKNNGIYWSITHKIKYAGGVVANVPIGIDIEEVLPRSDMLRSKIATLSEWNLGSGLAEELFFRYWTAKEAVLKAERVGLIGLSHCFIEKIIDKGSMLVRYKKKIWLVQHCYFDNHVAAVAADNYNTTWSIEV